jgi:GTP pyrophosphokinase/guanosine-3',5'-bis(diphosphate) 3'-pyrophosphohydrolase
MITAEDLIALVQIYNPKTDADLIARAYDYGQKMHEGQKRHSGEPYFTHPIAVAAILTEQKLDDASSALASMQSQREKIAAM